MAKTYSQRISEAATGPQALPEVDAPLLDDYGRVMDDAHDNTWICFCPPEKFTIRRADPEDTEDSDEDMEVWCGTEETFECVCYRPARAEREHKWVVTKKGFEPGHEWWVQQAHRDQENYDMYIFSRWTGYGISEVVENTVCRTICIVALSNSSSS